MPSAAVARPAALSTPVLLSFRMPLAQLPAGLLESNFWRPRALHDHSWGPSSHFGGDGTSPPPHSHRGSLHRGRTPVSLHSQHTGHDSRDTDEEGCGRADPRETAGLPPPGASRLFLDGNMKTHGGLKTAEAPQMGCPGQTLVGSTLWVCKRRQAPWRDLGPAADFCYRVTLGELLHVSVLQASGLSVGGRWHTGLVGLLRQHTAPAAMLCSPCLRRLCGCLLGCFPHLPSVCAGPVWAHREKGWQVIRQVARL